MKAVVSKLQKVNLFMPKFRVEFNECLNTVLQTIGIRGVFEDKGVTGMTDMQLRVTKVQHRCAVEVDEAGSEAAAATTVMLGKCARKHQPVEFKATRPYYFRIVDKPSQVVLFAGLMSNPGE